MRTLLIVLVLLLGSVATAADRQLIITAQDLEGNPLPDVQFAVPATSTTLLTNGLGMARLPVQGKKPPAVELADARFQVAGNPEERTTGEEGGSQFLFFRLLPAEIGEMSALERATYIDLMPQIIQRRWSTGETIPEEGDYPHELRLAAFLDGFGRERAPTVEDIRQASANAAKGGGLKPGEKPKPSPTISVAVVDRAGLPQTGRLVLLYGPGEKPGMRRVVESRRTNLQGIANFMELEAPGLYRPDVPRDPDNSAAPGPIIQLPKVAGKSVPRREITLVLRENERTLSGIVTKEGRPARGVSIATSDPAQPTVATVTDELGYFELGPLHPGETALLVRDPRTGRVARFAAIIGGNELLLPLEILMQD
jgi:hypothetical protein